jgi:hypothetical protein
MNTIENFEHKMHAHCETGTLVSLLRHKGFEITEPMAFGIANGIFFGYFESKNFPFPTFIVRTRPGEIRTKLSKALKIKIKEFKFKDLDKGMAKLDELLEQGIPVGAQVDFFYMDYFPEWMKAHNNVHFVNIIGKEGDKYIISDSYHREKAYLDAHTLKKARWAGGHMAPKGFLYYIEKIDPNVDLEKPIKKGIKKACRNMLSLPIPFIGIKGIYKFADKLNTWPSLVRDTEHLSHEIMKINLFLEDQGTGGAGFRYMYATFLKQASKTINDPALDKMSERIMKIGDDWRNISYFAAKIGKKRDLGPDKIKELSNLIKKQGDIEKIFFTDLKKFY